MAFAAWREARTFWWWWMSSHSPRRRRDHLQDRWPAFARGQRGSYGLPLGRAMAELPKCLSARKRIEMGFEGDVQMGATLDISRVGPIPGRGKNVPTPCDTTHKCDATSAWLAEG